MKTKIGILSILAVIVCGCSDSDSTQTVKPIASTTLVIYIAGNNNLSSDAKNNLKDITATAQGTLADNDNLLVLLSIPNQDPTLYKITAQGREELKTYPQQSKGVLEPSFMRGILKELRTQYPAKTNGLLLWSHGSAWLPATGYTIGNSTQRLSSRPDHAQWPLSKTFGPDTNYELELSQMAAVMPDAGYDFVIFDACYMASVEVAYELRKKSDWLLGCATEIPAEGMPYKKILGDLFLSDPVETRLKTVAQKVVDSYQAKATSVERSATTSLIRLDAMDDLAAATHEIITENYSKIDPINTGSIQHFDRYTSHCLYDLEQFISTLTPTTTKAAAFQQALSKVVVAKYNTEYIFNQIHIVNYCGLSSFIPASSRSEIRRTYYQTLSWYKAVYP